MWNFNIGTCTSLNRIVAVQECDARMLNRITNVRNKKNDN